MLRLASLTSHYGGGSQTEIATVNYGYDAYGKLTDITRDDTVYIFTYDSWGRVVDTKVGNIVLSTNQYDEYGRLERVSYGNGFVTEYVYDELDRVSEIKQGTAGSLVLTYKYIYNGEGDLYELRNYRTLRSTFFEYDHAGRCMASTEKSFTVSGSTVTYTGTISGYKYEYDANNNLSKLTCRLGDGNQQTSWITTYSYDKDNRPTTALLDNGRSVVNTYDAIGRITSRKIKNGNSDILETVITYVPGADSSKTALVATYQNGSDGSYSYTYDVNGNITAITKGSLSFTYTYDAANQLVRENLYYGSGNSNNATYGYTYDEWGNLLFRKKYTYNTQTNLSNHDLIETIAYGYSNTQWGDLLTSFNGSTITYDAMGNPTSYLGKTLAWEGKKLISYTDGSTNIAYAYNEDGLRLSKTVGTNITEYYYNGSVLIGMRIGTGSTAKFLRFSYDASGNVVAVDYSSNNGSSFTSYYYLRNAQNDIVKLIDGSGNTVVEYTYDSWGKVIAATGTLTTTLGTDQPFRYRGYVYDTETQWYYLQSRYYDPNTGRFVSPEPNVYDAGFDGGAGLIGYNVYAYCANNPINYYDSNGQFVISITTCIIAGLIIGVVGGISYGAYSSYKNTGKVSWKEMLKYGLIGGAIGALIGWGTGAALTYFGVIGASSAAGTSAATIRPLLDKLSQVANAAARKVNDFTVSAKHLLSGGGRYGKFNTDSIGLIRSWIREALRSSNAMFMPNNNNDESFIVIVDLGRQIGSKGETIIKIVLGQGGKIWTAYPVKTIGG